MKSRSSIFFIASLSLVLLLVTACQTAGAQAKKVSTPETGKTTVTGRVVSTSGQPHKEIPVRLAAVFRASNDGAFVLDLARSPLATADANGYFTFQNIDAGEYVIVVGDPEDKYTIIADDKGAAQTWKPEAGKVLDIGTIKASLPQ